MCGVVKPFGDLDMCGCDCLIICLCVFACVCFNLFVWLLTGEIVCVFGSGLIESCISDVCECVHR